ncbi:MAG: Fic family protein [Nitrospirae bacterium]|nr:Fic family protein [Nitrospirota bacterium]
MSKYPNSDHYTDPATGVLKNRLGITTKAELEEAEAGFAATRSYELSQNPLKGNFDLEHLKAIHGYIFKDLYEWAGQCRDVNMPGVTISLPTTFILKRRLNPYPTSLQKKNTLPDYLRPIFPNEPPFILASSTHCIRFAKATDAHSASLSAIWPTQTAITSNGKTSVGMNCIASFQNGDCSKFLACIRPNIGDL